MTSSVTDSQSAVFRAFRLRLETFSLLGLGKVRSSGAGCCEGRGVWVEAEVA